MARPSKTNRFRIYEDGSAETITEQPHRMEAENADEGKEKDPDLHKYLGQQALVPDTSAGATEDEEIRRESAITSTSISSFPDSIIGNGCDDVQSFRRPVVRPSFKRPEWMQRIHTASPPPLASSNHIHSRPHSAVAKSYDNDEGFQDQRSNSAQSMCSDQDEDHELEECPRDYPLVLLHITLLPVTLPWAVETMQEILPAQFMDGLHLLRSKVSDTIVQRGILIPHPREEYELLEERLLEALELQPERITKCGHFRSRLSTDTDATASPTDVDDSADTDSALGSSGSETEMCPTCHDFRKLHTSMVSTGKRKWSVKVYAANGLMRASAWAAAWNEMEKVDVEILPWIDENDKRKLDQRRDDQDLLALQKHDEEQMRIQELEEQVLALYEERERDAWSGPDAGRSAGYERQSYSSPAQLETSQPRISAVSKKSTHADLPPIYHDTQIPTSVLLKNYIYLLMQDRRNVVIVFLLFICLFSLVQTWSVVGRKEISANSVAINQATSNSITTPTISRIQATASSVDLLPKILESAGLTAPRSAEGLYYEQTGGKSDKRGQGMITSQSAQPTTNSLKGSTCANTQAAVATNYILQFTEK